ncbi:MAG TPA: acyloxyacyl hydrolase [Thermoanaerobaculia bacterium]|nr:acyloxyacyl hydrolase [Thermoanaerobaculia bacterium]
MTALLLALAPSRLPGQPILPPKGVPEWDVAAGYGFSVHLNRGRSDEHVLLFAPAAAFRLGSRLEYVVEGHFARYFTPHGYMVGVMPLGGRLFLADRLTAPYVSIGGGLGWTDLVQLDEIDRRFNFLLQGSVGLRRVFSPTQALDLEARLSHISNGGAELPNLGLNCVIFLLRWRFG